MMRDSCCTLFYELHRSHWVTDLIKMTRFSSELQAVT